MSKIFGCACYNLDLYFFGYNKESKHKVQKKKGIETYIDVLNLKSPEK